MTATDTATRRAKAAAAREAAERRERRRRTIIISACVAVALLLAGGIGFAVQSARTDTSGALVPAGAARSDRGIVVGSPSAPVTVDVYEDFQCPICRAFEEQSGDTISSLVSAKKIKVVYHTLAFLGSESERATNAAAAAANEGKFAEFHDVLFANQPEEHTGGFQNTELVHLGSSVGLTSVAFVGAVREGTYNDYIAQVNDAASRRGVQGTPTVYVNGERLQTTALTPDGITAAVTAAS
ncbi:thioredoxin domain-containing protein [Frankia sp. KB5]|uniref:DsbA family protein n=1 Tax=Frankia sp. KB5 TaxID=683318 RepID=UPI000A102586|nr:thioredoxin domain-containing protein [Frankia sp. KB5]ORT53458.1 phosphoesterase [Frankia sp. KB5]